MREVVQQYSSSTNYNKIIHWIKLIALTGGAQAIVQGTGLISGILIIRLLPIQEYAYYTIANTMLGTMTLLSDGGISTSVMAQGGKVWQDKVRLGIVLTTGLKLRMQFAVYSLIVCGPILIYLLLNQGASMLASIMIFLALIPAFFAALSDTLLEIAPKLHQDIRPLQKNQIGVSISRLLISALTLFIFPWTSVAILANGIPRIYGNTKLKVLTYKYINKNQKSNEFIREIILTNVKRIMPSSIYYCLSGQITIWLISVFGNITSIAQIGALGRLSTLLSFFTILIGTLIIPPFSKLPEVRNILIKYFLLIEMLCFIISVLIMAITITFPSQILIILGKNYMNLNNELVLSILISCVSFISGISFTLFTNRGWSINPILAILSSLASVIVGIILFNLNTLNGVLYFSLFTSVFQLILNISFTIFKINTIAHNENI